MSALVIIKFFVPGVPAPGGSKRGVVSPRTGRVLIFDACKRNGDWRSIVGLAGNKEMSRTCQGMLFGPLHVTMQFVVARPASHYGSGKNTRMLKPSAPEFPTVKPDVLKLARSTEDALTGILWKDDSQTVELSLSKVYGDTPGCMITVGYSPATTRAGIPRGNELIHESLAPEASKETHPSRA